MAELPLFVNQNRFITMILFNNRTFWNLLRLSLLGILIFNCSPKVLPPSAEVHYKGNKDQTILLTSVGYGENKRAAIFDAEKNAFNVLLFKGIPGSPFPKPIIHESEQETKSKNTDFFKAFYDDLGYRSFMKNTYTISPGSKDKQVKKTKAAVEITINVPSLRRELEQKGIIHKFGF